MKTILLIAPLLFLFSGCGLVNQMEENNQAISKIQASVTENEMNHADIIQYLQTDIINNKNKYLGRELSVLLNEMRLPVRSYYPTESYTKKYTRSEIMLSFFSRAQTEHGLFKQNKLLAISITFSNPLPSKITRNLFKAGNGKWLGKDANYYRQQIISNIHLFNWNLPA